ncbi:MAG: hypothetical protein R3A51_00980 [Nannocystaceae bacterium]
MISLRRAPSLLSLALLVACGGDDPIGTGTATETGADTDTETTSGSESDSEGTTAGPGSSSSDTGSVCTPGEQQACPCEASDGVEICKDDGSGFGECMCIVPECGNGAVEGDEECDEGAQNADDGACTSSCANAICGDGLVQAGVEVCDDGVNNDSHGGCAPGCAELGPFCGDGELYPDEAVEACDDGNDINGDGCNSDCVVSGTPLWTDIYPGKDLGIAVARGVAVDGAGNAIVVGQEFQLVENANIFLRKYSPDGQVIWSKSFNGDGSGDDIGRGVAVDSEDNIIAVGEVFVAFDNANAWIGKFDSDGNELWTLTHNGDDSGDDRARGVSVDRDDNIIVTGEEYHLIGLADVWTAKYGPDGDLWFAHTHDHAGGNDGGHGVATGADGEIFVVGGVYEWIGLDNVFLRRYSPLGVIEWSHSIDNNAGVDRARGAAVNADGDLVLTGETYTVDQLVNVWMGTYGAADGLELWRLEHSSAGGDNDVGRGVAVGPDGTLVFAGEEYEALVDTWVSKRDPVGEVIWEQRHDEQGGNDIAHGVAVDGDGNVYAVGEVYQVENLASLWITKYAP